MLTTATPSIPAGAKLRAEGPGTVQLVSFALAGEEFGIEIAKVQEIILLVPITRVPQTPPYIKGLINLRNTVIPIIDLRLRLGISPAEATDDSRIVVVDVLGKTMGILVDAVNEVLRVSKEQLAPATTVTGLGRDYVSGLVKLENRLLILLDIDKILGEKILGATL